MAFLITFTQMKLLHVYTFFCLLGLCSLLACTENPKGGTKPILLGDPSGIVTETDSSYLKNFTNDISPKQVQSSEDEITNMMVEVDSAKASAEMEKATEEAPLSLTGLTIPVGTAQIVLNGLEGHTLNQKAPDPALRSVAYVHDAGEWKELKLGVTGLSDVRVEQRLITRLVVNINDAPILLNSLGRFTSPWYNLPGNGKQFVSLGANSITYMSLEGTKIRAAAQTEINAKKWSSSKKQEAITALKPIRSFRDKPCAVVVKSIQWRISGVLEGKKIQQLVQVDLPNG